MIKIKRNNQKKYTVSMELNLPETMTVSQALQVKDTPLGKTLHEEFLKEFLLALDEIESDEAKSDNVVDGEKEFTFYNVTITIPASDAHVAYEKLCNTIDPIATDWVTDTCCEVDTDKEIFHTSELFPEVE